MMLCEADLTLFKGETCLSRSQEYTEINNLASIFAMRQLYGNTLNDFFNSREGPRHWANELFKSQTHQRVMTGILRNPIGPDVSCMLGHHRVAFLTFISRATTLSTSNALS